MLASNLNMPSRSARQSIVEESPESDQAREEVRDA